MDGKGFPKWKTTVDVNEGDQLEYKYCIVGSDGGIARWENKGSSANRKCKVTGDMLNSGLKDKPFGGGNGGGGGGGGHKHVSSGGRSEAPRSQNTILSSMFSHHVVGQACSSRHANLGRHALPARSPPPIPRAIEESVWRHTRAVCSVSTRDTLFGIHRHTDMPSASRAGVCLHPEPEDNMYLRLRLNRSVLRALRTRINVCTH